MATLNSIEPPRRGRKPRKTRLTTVFLLVVIAILLALLLRPVKLDVYKTVDEIEFADASLASCVQRAAVQHGWQDVGHIVSLPPAVRTGFIR